MTKAAGTHGRWKKEAGRVQRLRVIPGESQGK